jgi:hypothetical protein
MSIVGTARVLCPGCGREHDAPLVQSINTRTSPALKQKLLEGELNVLACECSRRTQLNANVLFHDPDADYFCQVAPGGEAAIEKAATAFRAVGAAGTQRIVPTLNALIEKVKLLDAGLEDWVIEMAKVLLLASIGEHDLDRVLLFEAVDREANLINWVLFGGPGTTPTIVTSPFVAYGKLVARTQAKPPRSEFRIDRAWAVEAVRQMISSAN